MSKKLIAVVLAGGVGSRFWPFTTSKTLFPFFGKKLFDFSVIDALPSEVTHIVVISNNENQNALSTFKFPKPTVTVLQPKPLGIADALIMAKSELADASLLIVIADDITDKKLLSEVVKKAKAKDCFAMLPGWKTEKYFPGGYLKNDSDRVVGIVEKPREGEEPSAFVAISGQYIADSNVLLAELMRTHGEADDLYERALTMLALRQKILFTPYSGAFATLKYPWNVLDMQDALFATHLRPSKGKNVVFKSNVTIEGPVMFGDNVKIFENTKIVGPAYIGDNTIVGNNNIIRQSHIGANCVTGFNTDITRSYVGDNCWFHSNYIGDSVLEGNITMGSGAVLANLRLDDGEISSVIKNVKTKTGKNKLGSMIGAHTRIGVNASVMPGIKVGSGTFIGSGIVLDTDIPENSYVVAVPNSFTVTPNTRADNLPSRDEFVKKL